MYAFQPIAFGRVGAGGSAPDFNGYDNPIFSTNGEVIDYDYSTHNVGGLATSWSATALPVTLSINSSTGVITGTITQSFQTPVTIITATNAYGSDTSTFNWSVFQ